MFKVIIIVVIVSVVALVALGVAESVINSTTDTNQNIADSTSSDELQVTITGQVNNAGTFLVQTGTDLGDLIALAGGLTSNADERAFETSYVLSGGGSYYIAPLYDHSNTCSNTPISKVCINTADASTLVSLSAFGNTVSNNIVSYRSENGSFHAIEELKNVSGIGNATFEKCKDYVTLC